MIVTKHSRSPLTKAMDFTSFQSVKYNRKVVGYEAEFYGVKPDIKYLYRHAETLSMVENQRRRITMLSKSKNIRKFFDIFSWGLHNKLPITDITCQ